MAFGISPATPDILNGENPPVTSEGFPRYIQFQTNGSDLGEPDVDTVDFSTNLTATRGTGENANKVTVTAAASGGGGSETGSLVVDLVGVVSGLFNNTAFSNWTGEVYNTSDDATWVEADNEVEVATEGIYSVRMIGRVIASPTWPAGDGTVFGSRMTHTAPGPELPSNQSVHPRYVTGDIGDNLIVTMQFTDEYILDMRDLSGGPERITPALYASSYDGTETATFEGTVIVKRLV